MFNFSFDKRMIYFIIGIMVLSTISKYIANPNAIFALLVSVPGVLIAITFHEFAHGYSAYKLGDNTAKNEGRLSLNPLDHLDPIGTLMLLLAGFGWGKPVHVNPTQYTRKISMEKGEAIVSLAGPATNIVLAFLLALIYGAMVKFSSETFLLSTVGSIVLLILNSAIAINIGLGVFNLIPLPPLDGSKIIMPLLPYNAKQWFRNNEQIFYIVFVVIWITGIASIMIAPPIHWISTGIMTLTKMIFGI
ncbi:MAG: site-2 protease family protein [Clostridia bacterium]|nr:site-2 protease family protein [Clostridia bacterium]